MNGKKAKALRRLAKHFTGVCRGTPGAVYFWIKRADGSVVRQLQPGCERATYQWQKGKGMNRVYVRQ